MNKTTRPQRWIQEDTRHEVTPHEPQSGESDEDLSRRALPGAISGDGCWKCFSEEV